MSVTASLSSAPTMGGGSYTERDNTVIPLPEKE